MTGAAVALDAEARARLGALADLMIPAGDGMPAASAAGVAGAGIDHLLGVRPDLGGPLRDALDLAAGLDPPRALDILRSEHPALFGALAELVAGAYYLDAGVADKVGYRGRIAILVDPDAPGDDDVLRQPVVDRGCIYRDDPRSAR